MVSFVLTARTLKQGTLSLTRLSGAVGATREDLLPIVPPRHKIAVVRHNHATLINVALLARNFPELLVDGIPRLFGDEFQ